MTRDTRRIVAFVLLPVIAVPLALVAFYYGGMLLLGHWLLATPLWQRGVGLVSGLLLIMVAGYLLSNCVAAQTRFLSQFAVVAASSLLVGQSLKWMAGAVQPLRPAVATILTSPLFAITLFAVWILLVVYGRLVNLNRPRSPAEGVDAGSSRRWLPQWPNRGAAGTWDSVILPAETKRLIMTIERVLQTPGEFARTYGCQVPRGLILHGPPGTGKTLIARTLAQRLKYHFLSVTPADVQQMWLGESEKVVAQLYARARQRAPCVVCIDEADALAASRSRLADPGGSARARANLLNQLLIEIDGMSHSEQVFTIAATNRLSDLDPAFCSRLSYHIAIELPNTEARLALFRQYTSGYRRRLSVPYTTLANCSDGMSGRDIASVCQWAALEAYSARLDGVDQVHFAAAFHRLGYSLLPASDFAIAQ
jgi:hypothetical protein